MRPISSPPVETPASLPRGEAAVDVFDTAEAKAIEQAQITHLDSLGLDIAGRSVLDVGCRVGNMARFFIERKCRVTCVDGRRENIQTLAERLPGVQAHVARVETDSLLKFGRFEIVFCYGLLDRLENPVAGLRNLAEVCSDLLLLETGVTDHELPLVRLIDEPSKTPNQALDGLGCRPSPAFVSMALTHAGFDFIYAPVTPPSHPDFLFERANNLDCTRDGHPLRCVFIASRRALDNPNLVLLQSAASARNLDGCFGAVAATKGLRTWLDVGAHLGEKTFAEAQNDPCLRVYAFEPNLKIASQRMGQLPNFVVLPMAVAEKDGSADFYLNEFDAASSLLPFDAEGLEQWKGGEYLRVERKLAVPTIRLDTFLQQTGIDCVELLKIDAPGADLAVVRSCGERVRDIERIMVEVQTTPLPLYHGASTKQEMIEFLESVGFELEFSETQSMGQEENLLFVRSPYADPAAALREAQALAFTRPLQPYPGWHFGIEWDNPATQVLRRRRVWTYLSRHFSDMGLEFEWHEQLELMLYIGNDLSRALFVEGCFDPNEFAFLEKFLQPGMVVVDAGANEGLYSLFAAKHGAGLVLAFEPSAREQVRLKANIDRNALTNVTVCGIALGDRDVEAVLHIATSVNAGQNTLGAFAYPGISLLRDERVEVRTLDGIFAEKCLKRLDLLKMDVEGAETGLIKGADAVIRLHRPVLLLEVSDAALRNQSSSRDELLTVISSLDYVFYVFDERTGLPKPARNGEYSANMIAAPAESPLPEAWCAAIRVEDLETSALQPLVEDAALFVIADHHICNDAQLQDEDPLVITTAPQQWSYALYIPVRESARAALPHYSIIDIRIEVMIESGRVGFGVVGPDGSTYLTPEQEWSSSGSAVSFDLMLSRPPSGSALVVRNTSSVGEASRAALRSVTTFLFVPRERDG
jgi:FkbM family methyltransferase